MGRMDQGKILLTRRQLERKIQETLEMTSFPVIFLFFLPWQIWSMDSGEPVQSLQVKLNCCCCCLGWCLTGKTNDVDGGKAAAMKSKENLTMEPVHSLKTDSRCKCLTWRPNGKTEDVDGGIAAERKSKENFTIVW